RAGGRGSGRAQIGHDGPRLVFVHVLCGHSGAGDAIADDLDDVVIRDRAFESAVEQVDSGDLVAFRAVAIDAIVDVLTAAVLHIGGRVFMLGLEHGPQQGNTDDYASHKKTQPSYCALLAEATRLPAGFAEPRRV